MKLLELPSLMIKFIKNISILILFCFAPIASGANIIFDLGDVLIETKYMRALWNIGPLKLVSYATTGHNPFGSHKKLFNYLDTILPADPNQEVVKDAHSHILPQLMVDWLKGTISGQEILDIIHKTPGNFANVQEEILVRAVAETIFTPEYFVQTRSLVKEGINAVLVLKKKGHKVYILSNWEPASFKLMQEDYPDFFALFDGIVISGDIGLVKPDPAIYEYLLHKYNLKPSESILIDDQIDNINAARDLGIHGILYQKKRSLFGSYHDFCDVKYKVDEISKDLPIIHTS